MFTGVVFVAFYTVQLAVALTVQQIRGGINGPDALQGKKVATARGGASVAALKDLRAEVLQVGRIEEA
jgi:polar amino acid transport system substrate-binding protein